MSEPVLLFEKSGHRGTLVLNRPKVLNAMTDEMIARLKEALLEVRRDSQSRVLVITGAGENFCGGADIKEWIQRLSLPPDVEPHVRFDFLRICREVFNQIENIELPVIAAIRGYCLGGGLELAMSCDLRIAAEDAKFGVPEINLGAISASSGTQRLARHVGVAKAKELVYLGEIIDAKEAQQIGLINTVVPLNEFDEFVNKVVAKLAEKSRIALRAAKVVLNRSLDVDLNTGIAFEAQLGTMVLSTEDAKDGYLSFVEKRRPIVKDR